eukprot:CAMPEP_0185594304 /NCGR_PEP_ID=MMETSP0434-20130131/74406_1 /TAXON_ID=626734 ORGANISM="Favella taraikaensis, Strain Fe Narragansett Bay" /NCGR_SAMPLE_ID=MMETSP0434 /ASSEMBLY_ACC=CAM_ASM_000379 /LENGTH=74 /DNA_ID=CAMNT_0028221525 /DNA_START=734 /DNA_END=961 /DNA_ORIENTATION=+
MNGVNQDFRNTSNEIFVGSVGDAAAEALKFFNVSQPVKDGSASTTSQAAMAFPSSLANSNIANPKFKEIKKVEL